MRPISAARSGIGIVGGLVMVALLGLAVPAASALPNPTATITPPGATLVDPDTLTFDPALLSATPPTPTPIPIPGYQGDYLALHITVLQRTWLQVEVDGKMAYQRSVRPGDVLHFEAQDRIRIRAANAAALHLALNGGVLATGAQGDLLDLRLTREDMPPTATPSPAPLPTTAYMACAWQWAQPPLPELVPKVKAALKARGIAYTAVRVSAFGENCLDDQGAIQYFATMQTEFDITLPVASLSDDEALGDLAAAVLGVLEADFPVASTPGPMGGRITLTFESADDAWRLITDQDRAAAALAEGLRGEALLAALSP